MGSDADCANYWPGSRSMASWTMEVPQVRVETAFVMQRLTTGRTDAYVGCVLRC